ncbi:hypothetical protein M8J77_006960 [Diaphorina citri]|nr:hypothetical protein M8J77_006960 [Diaphorina citri]
MDNKKSILPQNQNRTPSIIVQNNSNKVQRPEDIDVRNKLLPPSGNGSKDFKSRTPQSFIVWWLNQGFDIEISDDKLKQRTNKRFMIN